MSANIKAFPCLSRPEGLFFPFQQGELQSQRQNTRPQLELQWPISGHTLDEAISAPSFWRPNPEPGKWLFLSI
ncbi:MAG: hypothetical protein KBG95_06030 [Brachymonas sp.]|nr:hypothetical protein [Brachymonas sp.]